MRSIGHLGLIIVFALGCQTEKKPTAPPAFIFYTEQAPTACQWNFTNPYTHEKRVLYETPQCPTDIIWDGTHRQTIYTMNTSSGTLLYRTPWQDASSTVPLGPSGDLVNIWISRDSGRLRRAMFIETNPENTLLEGGTTYFLYKGGRYPTEEVVGDGIVGMAVVEEQNDVNTWTVIGARSTNWGAGDTMGIFVVESLMGRDPKTVTLQDLLQKATCAAQECPSDISQAPPAVKSRLKDLFPGLGSREGDGIVYKPLNADEGLLFATGMGDTLHAGGPVYYCQQACQEAKPLDFISSSSQLSVSTQTLCALVTEEYTGNNASLICAGQAGSPFILNQSHSAVWFPLPELWSLAKPVHRKPS